MQPVFSYRAEGYPPRGPQWPQFGDDVLEETLSLSEGARQSLNKKREAMSDFHREILQHHGLAPREDDPPPIQDPGPPADAMEMRLNDRGDDPPTFPRLHRGASGAAVPGAVHYGDDNLEYDTPDYTKCPHQEEASRKVCRLPLLVPKPRR